MLFSTDYDSLDQPVSVSYPKCISCSFPDYEPLGPERTMTSEYARGRLQNVTGFAGSMTYADNGMRTSLTHANGMIDMQVLDGTGMARPQRLYSSPSPVICTAPSVAVQPEGKTINKGGSATLTVAANGTGPLSYQWYTSPGGAIAGATGSSYLASPSATTTYYVKVTNACNTVASFKAVVAVNGCSAPTVSASRTVNKDGTVTLVAEPVASETVTCTWHRLSDGVKVADGTTVVVSSAVGIQALEVRAATSQCGTATATLADISPPPALVNLVATANGTTSVTISWTSAGLASYSLIRRHHGASQDVFYATGTSYTDTLVAPNTSYTYVLVNPADNRLISNVDIATTMVFSPIIPKKTVVSMTYFDELVAAVNAVRMAAGWPSLSWSTIMPPSVDVPTSGGIIRAIHLTALRPRMEEALHVLGVKVRGYTNPDPKLIEIKGIHVTELQARAK